MDWRLEKSKKTTAMALGRDRLLCGMARVAVLDQPKR